MDARTARYRFDIGRLADRLIAASDWMMSEETLRPLPVALFGASTGAAAALAAAARAPDRVHAVVSRGGRPDLAGDALEHVRAPTLLIVGELDHAVLALNEEAFEKLQGCERELVVIPGATHLFEERGALAPGATLMRGPNLDL